MTAAHTCITLQLAEWCHIKKECIINLTHSYPEEGIVEEIKVLQSFAQQVPVMC